MSKIPDKSKGSDVKDSVKKIPKPTKKADKKEEAKPADASLDTKAEDKRPEMSPEQKKEQEERFKIAQKFTKSLIEKFKRSVKAVVVYGSTATGKHKTTSDIDVFVIMDDTKIEQEIPQEVKDRIWNEMLKIAKDTDSNITLQAFMFITEFWENLRTAEPVLIAILRSGVPVFDVGIFMPAKRMLQRGKIPTTQEAVQKKISAAPQFVEYAESRVKSAGHYLEQAMATAGNAVLMYIGRMPQNKEDVPSALEESFVREKLLEERYVHDAESIRKFAKEVEHKTGEDLVGVGAEVDKYLKLTNEFVKRMADLIKELEQRRKSSVLMKTYKTFLKANVGALKYIGVNPPESLNDLPQVMNNNFPDLKDSYADLFSNLTRNLTLIKKGKAEAIPERDVYQLREQTKSFVIMLGKKLKDMKDKGEISPSKDFNVDNADDHPTLNPPDDQKKKPDSG
ncbi:MAG: nucleotidyltransferase domain-containing protein [archaeon]